MLRGKKAVRAFAVLCVTGGSSLSRAGHDGEALEQFVLATTKSAPPQGMPGNELQPCLLYTSPSPRD
eukprot:9695820-Alexandrium_andersonii.AAC.1